MQLLKWSLRDKKELIFTIGHFGEVNDHLLEMVRFFSLPSAIGVDVRLLQYLRTEKDARELGLGDDPSLALTISGVGSINESFELSETWSELLEEANTVEDRFAVFYWSESNMLRESCVYLHGTEPNVDPQTRNRINLHTNLLCQPKEKPFHIPPCQGWSYSPRKKEILYLFRLPSGLSLEPEVSYFNSRTPKRNPR